MPTDAFGLLEMNMKNFPTFFYTNCCICLDVKSVKNQDLGYP